MKPAIRVEGLSKQYRLGQRKTGYRTLRESIMSGLSGLTRGKASEPRKDESFWALKDVSFEIPPGQVVGLIGRNGAGKSTLLKLLSRIAEPTGGRIEIRGRIGSLLEVGTGFHPELTGRENIFLNGSILGMSRSEIDRHFDSIVAFSEVESFLDTPVKRYSSGMYVRLAFAVAAHLALDILLVDEVLAVGDIEFQKKCLAKMGDIAEGGRTVIFVSHNLGIIHRLCNRAILLRHGAVHRDGEPDAVIRTYLEENLSHEGHWERPATLPPAEEVSIRRIRILGAEDRVTGLVNSDDPFRVEVVYDVHHPLPSFEVGILLRNSHGVTILVSLDSDTAVWPSRTRPAGTYRSVCHLPGHLLAPGTYSLSCAAHIINQQTFDMVQDGLAFEVAETGCIRFKRNDRRHGVIMPVFDWEISRV
jgi:lipopolysaccharide transport system ATP-binding protein